MCKREARRVRSTGQLSFDCTAGRRRCSRRSRAGGAWLCVTWLVVVGGGVLC